VSDDLASIGIAKETYPRDMALAIAATATDADGNLLSFDKRKRLFCDLCNPGELPEKGC
jgi:hypothetical protein